jgi:hypothetical protein
MIGNRRAAALLVTIALLAAPPAALGAGKPSRLTMTAPRWLSTAHHSRTAAPPPPAGRQLPRTGFDLLPEVLLGGVLVAAGLVLRIRRAPGRG